MSFMDLAQQRYSERHFSPTPIEPEKLAQILEALAKVDRATKCRFGAPCVLVLAYDMTEAARNADVVDYGIVDVTIVGTQISLAAQELGVHSCWVGLIDPPELRRGLEIPSNFRIVAVMPLGYPSEKSRASYLHRTRKPLEQTTFFESYPKADGDGEGDEADA